MEETVKIFESEYPLAVQDMKTFTRHPVCTSKGCPMEGKPLVEYHGTVVCQAGVILDEMKERILSSLEYKLTESEEYEIIKRSPEKWTKRTLILRHPDYPWAEVKIIVDAKVRK
jgi:hypothetical protein